MPQDDEQTHKTRGKMLSGCTIKVKIHLLCKRYSLHNSQSILSIQLKFSSKCYNIFYLRHSYELRLFCY